jgi:hypothetical protein
MKPNNTGTKYLGAHVSAAGGVENAPLNASEIGQRPLSCLPETRGNGLLDRSYSSVPVELNI